MPRHHLTRLSARVHELLRPAIAAATTIVHPLVSKRQSSSMAPGTFKPKKIAIISKVSRYDYEKRLRPYLSHAELRKFLTDRGSDYEFLCKMHAAHHDKVSEIQKYLESRGVEVKTVERFSYDEQLIDWADAIITAGGDGTFLLGASKVKSLSKPLFGVNTDLISWMFRQRIRITMSGKHANDPGIELHDEQLHHPEFRFTEHVKDHEETNESSYILNNQPNRVLPVLALNEVFVGEALSSRVSYYELSIDESNREKQKSSGVTVSTGTGSSSWFFHINHLHKTNVSELMKIINSTCEVELDVESEVLSRRITETYNTSLTFDPSAPQMAFTVRDPVVNGIFQVSCPRGFAKTISIKSRMWDARLVVDGGVSFNFNDGAIATMEIHPEDSLRTATFDNVPSMKT